MKPVISIPVLAASVFLSTATLAPVLAAQNGAGQMGQGMMMGQPGMAGGQGMGVKMGAMGKGQGMMAGSMMGKMMKMSKKMMGRKFFVRAKPYSNEDIKRIVDGRLAMHGFSGLKAGMVKDAGMNMALAEIVSPKGEFLFRVKFNRKSGMAVIVE
jgi:hypothetical protein